MSVHTYTVIYSDDFQLTYDNLSLLDVEALLHADTLISENHETDVIMVLINDVIVYDFHEDYGVTCEEQEHELVFRTSPFESVVKSFDYNVRIKFKDIHYIFT